MSSSNPQCVLCTKHSSLFSVGDSIKYCEICWRRNSSACLIIQQINICLWRLNAMPFSYRKIAELTSPQYDFISDIFFKLVTWNKNWVNPENIIYLFLWLSYNIAMEYLNLALTCLFYVKLKDICCISTWSKLHEVS